LKKKAVSGILLTLLLIGTLTSAFAVHAVAASSNLRTNTAAEESTVEDLQFALYGTNQSKKGNKEQAKIIQHRTTDLELRRLIQETGVWEECGNYNQTINGYGTGLRPPTEEEWAEIACTTYFVEKVLLSEPSSSSVDHTIDPWFPPIGDQGEEGSCVAWAVGYYMKTYQEAKEHGWDLSGAKWEGGYHGHPTPVYQNRIISPDFIYHLINGGVDQGSYFYSAIDLVCSLGASSWEKMPYDPADHTTWPSEEAWREAPMYRGNSSGYEYMPISTDAGLTNLKNWISSDHLAVIGVDGHRYSSLTSQDIWTLDNYVNPSVNHANTIVGYDDTISYVEQGQTRYGAFKIANSWGIGGWENIADGCYWISYEAMKQRIWSCMFYRDMIGYEPELVSSFRIAHSKRGECSISIGVGDPSNPDVTKSFSQLVDGGDQPFCSNDILFDITEFRDVIPTIYNKSFFLEIGDWSSEATGTVNEFAIEYAKSQDTPLDTIQRGFVHTEVLLPPLNTSWTNERLVNLDADFMENQISIATDGNGFLYLAYSDWYPAINQCAVFVKHSTDGGGNWETDFIGYDSTHDIGYPSLAIDPYSNDIFVAVEREWTLSDHDILVLRRVSGVWSWSSVASVLGSDDRFPSITSEYQYGGSNRQYISYEYVYSYDDRDLIFAKSADHGATWSTQKLHGNWPDGNVHAQTSITNAEDYIYIAYKWGADYNSPCEIRIDRSADFGSTWSQYADIDGLSNGCSFPSIAATHGGSSVLVAFQYQSSATDIDVWYSYSTNKGASWTKGKPLFSSGLEDEKQPVLTVDGGGTTNNDVKGHFYVISKAGSYIKYRKAHCSNLHSWSNPEFVSDRWIGEESTVTTQLRAGHFYPCVAWTCGRTRNVYYSTREPSTISVPHDYSTIQAAINAAHPKDTIHVENGVYYERVVVNKTVSLIGENQENTIIEGLDRTEFLIDITVSNVTVEGFTLRNGHHAIHASSPQYEYLDYIIIRNNIITQNNLGVLISSPRYCRVESNVVISNREAVALLGSSMKLGFENTVRGNVITHQELSSIDLMWSSGTRVVGNTISFNSGTEYNDSGLGLWYSNHTTVYHNNFVEDFNQIYLEESHDSIWDDGYPSGGNYWSDYAGLDADGDGIGDTSYIIDANNRDRYPLMKTWPSRAILENGFESGSFSAWSGTSVSSGETASVTNTMSHHGIYSAIFTSNGGGGWERARCYKSTASFSELYVRAYVLVSQSGIVDNDDRIHFIRLRTETNEAVFAGWRKTGGLIKWTIAVRHGTGWVDAYSASRPSLNRWYCVELYWKKDSVNGLSKLWVDGTMVCSVSGKNTAYVGDVNRVDFGLAQLFSCGVTKVYGDCWATSTTYIDPEPVVKSFAVQPTPFSPNGDGVKDTTAIKATFNVVVNWNLQVRTSTSVVLRTWIGTSNSLSVVWDGKNSAGVRVADGTYNLRLSGADLFGVPFTTKSIKVTVDTKPPTVTSVSVYPTSFNPRIGQTTKISYTLSESSYITVRIYNSAGTLVRTLLNNALQSSGYHSTVWNGKYSSGTTVPTGKYTIKIWAVDKAGSKATSYPIIKTVAVL